MSTSLWYLGCATQVFSDAHLSPSGDSRIPDPAAVELESGQAESLYVEAMKRVTAIRSPPSAEGNST
jgi:hypothetical protein